MQSKRTSDLTLLRRLWSDAQGFRWYLVLLLLLNLLAAPLTLAIPVPLKIGIDCVVGEQPLPAILRDVLPVAFAESTKWLMATVVVMILCIALLTQLRSLAAAMLQHYVGEQLVLRFRARLFERAQHLSFVFHDSRGTADSLYRIQHDGIAPNGVLVNGLTPLITSVVTTLAMGIVTAMIDWRLTVVALTAAVPLVLVIRAVQPTLRSRWRDAKQLESSVLEIVQEVLSSLRVVRAFGQEDYESQRFALRADQGIRARLRAVLTECLFGVVIGLIFAGGSAAVLAVGVLHARAGAITLGDLTLVMFYLIMLYQPLESIGKTAAALQSSLASAERAYALLDQPHGIEPLGGRPLVRAVGRVEFRNVSFGFDKRRTVLDEVSLCVPAGSRVGIAGTTGAGKTTLISLLLRFYDPTDGAIFLDGADLREYDLSDLRKQASIVLQDAILFSTTIADNICYGCPDADQAEMIEAARRANAHDFITRLPDAYDTQVGERGMGLSGGERQRIALAREFLRDAPILILDEPTSALDAKTEAAILEIFERLMEDRTTFVISHRLNMLEHCDVRVQLEHGRVVTLEQSMPVS